MLEFSAEPNAKIMMGFFVLIRDSKKSYLLFIISEQPIFTCKAHVFHLEPEQKKSWIALSTVAVNVQIFYDSLKNIYRIVSVEGTKVIL